MVIYRLTVLLALLSTAGALGTGIADASVLSYVITGTTTDTPINDGQTNVLDFQTLTIPLAFDCEYGVLPSVGEANIDTFRIRAGTTVVLKPGIGAITSVPVAGAFGFVDYIDPGRSDQFFLNGEVGGGLVGFGALLPVTLDSAIPPENFFQSFDAADSNFGQGGRVL